MEVPQGLHLPLQRRMMLAEILEVLVTVIMENQLFQFDGRIYQQQNAEGGKHQTFQSHSVYENVRQI